jgi:hypothetical protein
VAEFRGAQGTGSFDLGEFKLIWKGTPSETRSPEP